MLHIFDRFMYHNIEEATDSVLPSRFEILNLSDYRHTKRESGD